MATLSVKFIKTTKRDGALYCDREVVKTLSLVGRRMLSEEKKQGYEIAYYCRKTKSQCECWLVKHNGHWDICCGKNDFIPNVWSYDSIVVSIY